MPFLSLDVGYFTVDHVTGEKMTCTADDLLPQKVIDSAVIDFCK